MNKKNNLLTASLLILLSFLFVAVSPAAINSPGNGVNETGTPQFPSISSEAANSTLYLHVLSQINNANAVSPSGVSGQSLPRIIANISTNSRPDGMALDTAHNLLYLADEPAYAISVISLATNKVVKNITDIGGPFAAIYDPGRGEIFVTNYIAGTVSVINDTSNKIVQNITVGKNPDSGVYDPSKGYIYIDNLGYQTLSVINDATDKVVDTIGPYVGGGGGNAWPDQLMYDPKVGEIFAPGSNGVDFINDTNNTVVNSIDLGNNYNGAAFDSNNGDLYLAGGSYVYIVSIAQAKLVQVINYQSVAPYFAAVGYDTIMHDVYVLEVFNNNPNDYGGWADLASIVSDSTNTVIGNVSVPVGNPSGILFDPHTGEMFVSGGQNGYYAQVSVISPVNLTMTPGGIDLGSSTSVSFTTIKYAPVLSYSYSGLPPGAVSQNKSSYTFTPTSVGKYTIHGYANDSGGSAISSAVLKVNPAPHITSFTASPSQVNAGSSTVLDVSVSGGTSPFSYKYTGLPPGGSTSDQSSISFSPTAVGTYTVNVYVNDSSGGSTNSSLTLTVNPGVVVPSISVPVNIIDVGQTMLLSTHVSGGVGPYVYSYSASKSIAGNLQSSGSKLTLNPTAPGNFTVSVKVTDSLGDTGNAITPTINVDPQMNVTLTVSNATPLLGQTVAIVTDVTGGSAPYSYVYRGLPPGAVSENKPAIGFLPTQSDYYNMTVTVTDKNGNVESSSVSMHVIFDFNVIVPSSISAGSPFTISVNTNETFSGSAASSSPTISGGIGILTYNYTGLPPGVQSRNSPTLKGTTDQPGTYHVTVSVKDQAGDHRSHTVTLVVKASVTSDLASFFSRIYGYAAIGGIIAVLLASAAVLRRRHRT